MMSLHVLRCCCGLCVRTGVALSAFVPAWVCNMCCDFCYALASVVVVLAVFGVHRCCIVAVRSLLCCGCLFHVALCVYVSTLSGDVLVVGVRSSRCFAVLFPLCVRSYCVLCLCVESLRDCVSCLLFVVEDVRGYLSSINISIIIIMSRAVPAVAKEGACGICEL